MSETVELRPFPPFLPPQARVIMMGSFPPALEKRAMDFHYPNFNNDMWRVYGLIFFNDKDHFRKEGEKAFDAEKIKSFLSAKGIASCPSVVRAIREKGNGPGRTSVPNSPLSPYYYDRREGYGNSFVTH